MKKPTKSKRTKPPVGFQEAARLLTNVLGMPDTMRTRRLAQAAYNISCAIPWAEKALAASNAAESAWLRTALSELKRAEHQLGELVLDPETERRSWQLQLGAVLQTFETISLLYARGEFGPDTGFDPGLPASTSPAA